MFSLRPEKVDFVRMAGMFDAIIVPFSSVGIAESVNIFFDKEGGSEILNLLIFSHLKSIYKD